MDTPRLLVAAQDLVRQPQDPAKLAGALKTLAGFAGDGAAQLQGFAEAAGVVGDLLRRQGELAEAAAEQRHADAEAARERERATLERTIEGLKADLTALKTERQGLRDALQRARDEQAKALATLRNTIPT